MSEAFEKWFEQNFKFKEHLHWYTEIEKKDVKDIWEAGRNSMLEEIKAKWPREGDVVDFGISKHCFIEDCLDVFYWLKQKLFEDLLTKREV